MFIYVLCIYNWDFDDLNTIFISFQNVFHLRCASFLVTNKLIWLGKCKKILYMP